MLEFISILRANREDFIQTMTPEEREVMEEHINHLRRLDAEGKLILAGPCLDGAFGIAIFRAESAEEARGIFEADPAVAAGIGHAELHPYRVSMIRCG